MRIVVCGDTHIGAVFGLGSAKKDGGNTRVDDYEKTLNHIVSYCIDNNVDAFIQTGDLFESRNPDPEHMDIVSRAIKRLSMANITSLIIMGNHDYIRNSSGFTSAITSLAAKDYPNVRIVVEPDVISLSDNNGKRVNVVLLPYRDRRMYLGKSTKDDSKLYDEEVKELIDSCEGEHPIIAVGHNFYYTGSYNDYSGAEILANIDSFKKCDFVAMGHYHTFKILRKKDPISIYTGSMEKVNFGDQDIKKYFIDYDTETKKSRALPCPSRELLDISIDMTNCQLCDIDDALDKKLSEFDLKDKIARVKLSVKDKVASSLKKSKIEKLMYSLGSFYVSRVVIEPVFEKVVRDDAILEHKDDYSMFEAFIKDQELEEEDEMIILSQAKAIML